jgi:hypothetical protein
MRRVWPSLSLVFSEFDGVGCPQPLERSRVVNTGEPYHVSQGLSPTNPAFNSVSTSQDEAAELVYGVTPDGGGPEGGISWPRPRRCRRQRR